VILFVTTPEKTMDALMQLLPKKYWIEINRLLVPFGKQICTAAWLRVPAAEDVPAGRRE
jgi:endonuclease-3